MTKKKPWWVKLLISLLSLVLVVAIAIGGVYFYAKSKFGIDIFQTISQLKIMAQNVDEATMFTNKFTEEDMKSAKETINEKAKDVIAYNETDGYSITTSGLTPESNLTGEIKLTDKQVGAVLNTIISNSESDLKINFGSYEISIEIIQIKFEQLDIENNTADVNIVMKLDISAIKNSMNSFPLSLFNKYIPKTLYISSTCTVTKGSNPFEYNVQGKSLTINKLDKTQSENIVKVLDLVTKIGTSTQLCETLCTPMIDAIIGNESSSGFAYSFKSLGAKDYAFETVSETIYFVIKVA